MIIIQAVPPIPPRIPVDPNLILTSLDPPAIVMVVLLVMAACTIVLWPLARALARRLEGRGSQDAILRAEVDALHNRLADVDALQARLGELEERLDFAERIIARGESVPAQLPRRGS